MRRRPVPLHREQTEERSVAGLKLAQAFEQRGKAKGFCRKSAPGGNFISGRPSAEPDIMKSTPGFPVETRQSGYGDRARRVQASRGR